MSRFRTIDRYTDYLLPPSVDEWLPENHLARFIGEVVEGLDLASITQAYAGRGSKAYHPARRLSLLVYGYATGVFASRRLEQATYDSVAFRYSAAGCHPDPDTLASFRRRFLDELAEVFEQVLKLAHEMNMLKRGQVSLDGTQLHANASRHSALSYGQLEKREVQLKPDVQELLAWAEPADQSQTPEGMSLPDELQRREVRLQKRAEAKARIEARAQARFEQEQAAYQEKLARREARPQETGRKPGGKPPKAPEAGPQAKDQINLTDEDSRIMQCAGGGFEQGDNAPAAVDTESMGVVATAVTQAGNDQQPVVPMLDLRQALPDRLGEVNQLLADTGYCRTHHIAQCEAAGIDPLRAVARQEHQPHWPARFEKPEPLPQEATPLQKMAHKLKTKTGREADVRRQYTVEPVFGIIKSVLGFRQFLLRGLEQVTGEWRLVCLAWNLKRMAKLRPIYANFG